MLNRFSMRLFRPIFSTRMYAVSVQTNQLLDRLNTFRKRLPEINFSEDANNIAYLIDQIGKALENPSTQSLDKHIEKFLGAYSDCGDRHPASQEIFFIIAEMRKVFEARQIPPLTKNETWNNIYLIGEKCIPLIRGVDTDLGLLAQKLLVRVKQIILSDDPAQVVQQNKEESLALLLRRWALQHNEVVDRFDIQEPSLRLMALRNFELIVKRLEVLVESTYEDTPPSPHAMATF